MDRVYNDIDRIFKSVDKVSDKIDSVEQQLILARLEIASLKVRAGVWGLAAGMLPAIAFYLAELFRK